MILKMLVTTAVLSLAAAAGFAARELPGETLYRKHCSSCHPDAAKLRNNAEIEHLLRNPPPFMPAYDPEKICDRDAKALADFVRKSAPQGR